MFEKLHLRLTLYYTFTTGIILTLVVICISVNSQLSLARRIDENFQTHSIHLTTKLQTDNTFSITWLSAMEAENGLLIHIEENGIPLLYRGSWTPPSGRDYLIQEAAAKARKLGIDISKQPISSYSISPVYRIHGTQGDQYQCIAMSYPFEKGYKSLLLLYDITPSLHSLSSQRILYAVIDLVGIGALFLVSWFLVKRSLHPIRENQSRQQRFLSAASHELRSPLMVIQSSAQAIEANPQRASLFTANILSECSRMSRLIQDMLTLASADSGNWSVNLTDIDPLTFLLDLYESYEPVCQKQKIPFRLELPAEVLPTLSADPQRLTQALEILIDNALTYCTEGTPIELKAKTKRSHLSILVIDHGPGIPDDQKEAVFDRFYRGDPSRQDKQHFGLGLSIAKELAVLHKGSLSLEDTPDGGCTFILELPLANHPSCTR